MVTSSTEINLIVDLYHSTVGLPVTEFTPRGSKCPLQPTHPSTHLLRYSDYPSCMRLASCFIKTVFNENGEANKLWLNKTHI